MLSRKKQRTAKIFFARKLGKIIKQNGRSGRDKPCQTSAVIIRETRAELADINAKIKRVIDTYIDQDIDRPDIWRGERS